MDFDLGDEHVAIRETVRSFAEARGRAASRRSSIARSASPSSWSAGWPSWGSWACRCRSSYGGAGADTLAYAITVEELTRVDSSLGVTVAAHTSLGTSPILLFGSDEQKDRHLPDLCSGRALAAFGLTEPEAGSDAGNTRTRARSSSPTARGWSTARRCSSPTPARRSRASSRSPRAPARTRSPTSWSRTARRATSPGRRCARWAGTRPTRGPSPSRAAGSGADALLGPRGRGLQQFLEILDGGRISIAAMGLGLAQGAYEQALAYAGQRNAFGRPIKRFQAVQFKLADMATEIAAGRHLTYHAAWLKDRGRPFAQEAAMAKLYTGELSRRVANESLQIHGGYGFMEEFPISRFYRDAKVLEIGEGTNEIQRLVIARGLGC